MKTVSQQAVRKPRSVEGSTLHVQTEAAWLGGRSSHVSSATWIMVAAASTAAVLIAVPALAGWLLLPTVPAILMRWACRDGHVRCDRAVMRVFSIATFVAIMTQLVVMVPALFPALVVASAVMLFLFSVEQLAVTRSDV